MVQSENCPYKGVTKRLCPNCAHYIPDTDECSLDHMASISLSSMHDSPATCYVAPSYEEKLKEYNEQRDQLMKLSKEQLIDLIIKPPYLY